MGTATLTLRNDRIQAQTQAQTQSQTQNQIPTWHIDPANGHGERGVSERRRMGFDEFTEGLI